MHVMPRRPDAALGVEHVTTGEHAHVVLGRGVQLLERIEVAALEHDALRRREARFAHVGRIVVDHRHGETHVVGERRHFAGRVGRAQQPNMHLVEQRDARPGEALELLVVHRGAARDVLHLERVAGRVRPRRHDLLRVVAEEHERLAVGRALVAVLLRHLVVGVALSRVRIVDDLETEPGEVALLHRAQGALERGRVVGREAFRHHVEIRRIHVLVAFGRLVREAREILHAQGRRAALAEGGDDGLEGFLVHEGSFEVRAGGHLPGRTTSLRAERTVDLRVSPRVHRAGAICTLRSSPTVTRPSATRRSTSGYRTCSTSWMRASRSSRVSSSRTSTARCATMGPLS